MAGLDQYGAEPFEHQQFGTAGVQGVNDFNRQQAVNRTALDIHVYVLLYYLTLYITL